MSVPDIVEGGLWFRSERDGVEAVVVRVKGTVNLHGADGPEPIVRFEIIPDEWLVFAFARMLHALQRKEVYDRLLPDGDDEERLGIAGIGSLPEHARHRADFLDLYRPARPEDIAMVQYAAITEGDASAPPE